MKGDPISHHVNTKNAKQLALLIVVGFTIYHGILHVSYGMLAPIYNVPSKYII